MSLQDHVRAFTDDDADYIRADGTNIEIGTGFRAGMSCHNATFIWLYRARHGGDFPALADMLDVTPQQFVDSLIRLGNATRVTMGRGPLPNDVLIFADPATPNVGRHSCVVVGNGQRIGGYNQAGWFGGGIANAYSEHGVDSFDWVARRGFWSTPRRATAADAQRYVWAVREATAVGLMR